MTVRLQLFQKNSRLHTAKGFTLIEILIVIVIIGITVGFALIAFGDFGESKRILFAAEQLNNTLKLAQQQAILESSTLGVRIDNSSYQILKLQNNQWSVNNSRGLYKVHYFPKNMIITFKGHNKTNAINAPNIVINSAGELSAFTLDFGTNNEKRIATLSSNEQGDPYFTAHPK